ncbi:hypothetical protein IKW73_02390 [Candidatus Saccharibacteria bacterium]|nr:hypothetical protein [Candidatus Saccharibacteria bacterium]
MGKPIAQINVDGVWAMPPYGIGIGSIVIKKAEQLTQEYREKIIEAYKHNALYGSDSYDKI